MRYYGYYSNASRGKRKEAGTAAALPSILEVPADERTLRKNWARLIQKIYEVDPLICPHCQGVMRVIGVIEDPTVIRAILTHLGLWLATARPPPKASAIALPEELLFPQDAPATDLDYADPDYGWDAYIQS